MTLASHEITDLPAFNDFQRKAREFINGNATYEMVAEALSGADTVLASMLFDFHEGLRFQPETPFLREAAVRIYDEFNLLRVHLPLVAKAAESHDLELVQEHLEESRTCVTTIFQVLDSLRQQQNGEPRFSEMPMAHELIRVGQLVLEGVLSRDLLQERFQQYLEFHQNLANGMMMLNPTGAEVPIWESSQDTLAEALELQEMGLETLGFYLQSGDSLQLEDALDMIGRASDWLVGVQRALTRLPDQEGTSCPRCSGCNPAGQRYCQHCQALLPSSGPAPESSFTVGEGTAEESPLGEHVQKLAEAVADFEAGRAGKAQLLEALSSISSRVERASQGLERIQEPSEDTPEDQRQLFESAWEKVRDGLELFREGLDLLRQERLEGLDRVLRAVDQLQEIPRMWEGFLKER